MMNIAQTVFTIFYGMYFAVVIGLSGTLVGFDTPSMYKGNGKAWLRFVVSFLLLNLLPLFYFVYVYRWLSSLGNMEITVFNMIMLLLLSLAGFSFYRIYWGIMLLKWQAKLLFYEGELPKTLKDKIDNHQFPEAAGGVLPNVIPGLVWLFFTITIAYTWTHGC
jgi:hypothetical protein